MTSENSSKGDGENPDNSDEATDKTFPKLEGQNIISTQGVLYFVFIVIVSLQSTSELLGGDPINALILIIALVFIVATKTLLWSMKDEG